MRPAPCFLLLTIAVVACAPTKAASSDSAAATVKVDVAAEEKAIRDLDARLLAAVQQRDSAAIGQFYAASGLFMAPDAPPRRGPQGAGKGWRLVLAQPGATMHFAPTLANVADAGDMAYVVGTYSYSAGRTAEKGKYLMVWRKYDGDWKIVADMFNSDGAARN